MAAATVKGEISIWNVRKGTFLSGSTKGNEDFAVTSLAWNPSNNAEIVYTDNTGQICMIRLSLDEDADAIITEPAADDDDFYNESKWNLLYCWMDANV
jgi:WD40 repeat protein